MRVLHRRHDFSGGGFATYSSTSGSGGFNFGSSKWGSEFATYPEIMIEHVSDDTLLILTYRLQGKTAENTVLEAELTKSDFVKATAIIFDKIYQGKDIFLQLSKFVDLIETLGEGVHTEDLACHMRKIYLN